MFVSPSLVITILAYHPPDLSSLARTSPPLDYNLPIPELATALATFCLSLSGPETDLLLGEDLRMSRHLPGDRLLSFSEGHLVGMS